VLPHDMRVANIGRSHLFPLTAFRRGGCNHGSQVKVEGTSVNCAARRLEALMMTHIHHRSSATIRDHARRRHQPASSDPAIEAHLTQLVRPATYALVDQYHRLGLRERILTLPVMVTLLLSLIWRQVPSVSILVQMLAREKLLWEPPRKITQQALSARLHTLPVSLMRDLVHTLLPQLAQRSAARERPVPAIIAHAQQHFRHLWIADGTTLEALFHKLGTVREEPGTVLGGSLLALLDVASKLPVQLWWDDDPAANDKRFLPQLKQAIPAGALVLLDKGFYAFPLFDWFSEHACFFLTLARSDAAFTVERVLAEGPLLRDRIIQLGQYRANPCQHPVRLVELKLDGRWHRYLTNVLDPTVLSAAQVADLYSRRWRIEEAFSLVKRLLGLAYLWTGGENGIQLQIWATWLLYAVLVDLSDAVAEELNLPLERISCEMVYRGLYHFSRAYERGEATDPVRYLAAQTDLGIVKRRRKSRERAKLARSPYALNL
jgi:hypothetical protein